MYVDTIATIVGPKQHLSSARSVLVAHLPLHVAFHTSSLMEASAL